VSDIVPAQVPNTVTPPGDPHNVESRVQRAMAAMSGKGSAAPAQEPAPAPPEPEAAPDKPAADPAPAAPDKPAILEPPPAADPKPDDDLRLARAQRAAQQREREAYEAKQAAKSLEKQLADTRAELDRRKADAEAEAKRRAGLTALELIEQEKKTSYEQLTRDIVDKKYEPKTPEQLAIARLEQALESERAERERDRAERETERKTAAEERERVTREQQSNSVAEQLTAELKANAAHFPVLASLPWAAKQIVRMAEQTGKTYAEVAQEMERAARGDVETVFSSDDTLKVFLGNESVKSRVLSLLGIKQTPASPASEEGSSQRKGAPAAIPQSRSADPGTRVKTLRPVTTEDRIQIGLKHLEAKTRSR
jgi:hypothetical protein